MRSIYFLSDQRGQTSQQRMESVPKPRSSAHVENQLSTSTNPDKNHRMHMAAYMHCPEGVLTMY